MLEYLMYIFSEQIYMFGYLKTPDIILSIVSSKKLDWTHTFDTHCTTNRNKKVVHFYFFSVNLFSLF